jgi:hypothetical protein
MVKSSNFGTPLQLESGVADDSGALFRRFIDCKD